MVSWEHLLGVKCSWLEVYAMSVLTRAIRYRAVWHRWCHGFLFIFSVVFCFCFLVVCMRVCFCVHDCFFLHRYVNMCYDEEKTSCNISVPHLQRWLTVSPGAACMPGSSSLWSFRQGLFRSVLKTHSILKGCLFIKGFNNLFCSVITSFLYGKSGLTHKFITGVCFQTYSTACWTRGKVTAGKYNTNGGASHFSYKILSFWHTW